MTGPLHSQWGQSTTLPEPGLGARPVRAVIGDLSDVDLNRKGLNPGEDAFPRARDWTVYARAEAQAFPRFLAPSATLMVEWGSGAFAFLRSQPIPVAGCVVHVVGQFVRAWIDLANNGLPPNGDIRLQGQIAPGRPERVRAPQLYPVGQDIPIPPWATGFVASEVGPGISPALSGRFVYQGLLQGSWGPMNGVWSEVGGVAPTADALRPLPSGGATGINVFWETDS